MCYSTDRTRERKKDQEIDREPLTGSEILRQLPEGGKGKMYRKIQTYV